MLTSNTRGIWSPFTTTQWQELEHQALIFKYIVSGVPIPPDLIYSVKRSLESAFSSRLFPHNPTSAAGWGCFEMGFGRKIDPEPGRCRRTDGKKWRCSKEAHSNSKYCEKHMHRGRNRSRKPVEVSTSTTTSTITNPSLTFSSINRDLSSTSSTISSYSSLSSSSITPEPDVQHNCPLYPYPHSASSRPSSYGVSATNNTTYFSPKSDAFNQTGKEYSKRNFQGIKESEDEEAFFPQSSRNASHPLINSFRDYSQQQYQGIRDNPKISRQPVEQHCFILGTDFKSPKPNKADKEPENEKHLHHFFGEWPPKNTDSWLDLASNSRIPNDG